jgi:tetratricopeptide (TPR) repeat protein
MAIEEYASARATPELVGRKNILEKIYNAIKEKSRTPHVFYITAPGGWGKTRLLDEVLKKLNGNMGGAWASTNILSASRLVDLYHTYTHSEEGLIADIVEVLDDEQGSRFVNYLSQRAELDRVKYDLSQVMRAVTQQRERMMQAFVDDFNEVGNRFDKTVLAFDTVENLTYLADRVQMALGLAGKSIGVAEWLVYDFLPNIQNTVVLIAGRPETPQLKIELEKLRDSSDISFTAIELGTLSEEETLAYFDAVLNIVRAENPKIAKRLETIKEETKRVVYYLSEGKPFLLSLFVDYLAIAEELFPGVREPLSKIKEKADSANGLQIERNEFQDAILQEFQRIRRPFDEVVQALSWTRKGMGAELLAWILKRGEPSEEEIAEAKGYIETLRDPDLRLSFVKIRDIDQLVFLQDEMYKLMQSLHQRGRLRHNVRQTYELITKFYEKRIAAQAGILNSLQRETNALLSSGSWKEITESQKAQITAEQQKLREARARLQSYQVEHVYYCLQTDYIKGIQAYYRLAEAAFQSNDTNLWLLLRDELLKFAEPLRSNENEREALKYIDGDIGVRWIKTNIASGQYDRALQQIERFRITPSDLLEEGSFAELSLRIFKSWALIYSGKEYEQAKSILESVFASLNKLTDEFEPEFDEWRLKLLRAYAQDIFGYMYRSQGNFAKAVGYFKDNIRLWQDLRVDSELAKELNDLSWSLTEMGDFQSALPYCEDGLELRRRLGHRFPIALSLNTLGLIETRNGQPERARFRSEQALGIFRDLEQPRGIGLACTALAESLRRMIGIPDLLTEEQAFKNLELAEGYAKEAVEIFTNTVQERLRLVEANIELGCVYREMARIKFKKEGKKEAVEDLVAKGKDAFDTAVKNAEAEFAYRAVDSLVNKAWMYYYIDEYEEAHRLVDQVLGIVDPQYLFTRERGPLHGDELVPWHWVQLGKAYLLLGRIAIDKYELACQQNNEKEIEAQLHAVARQWTLSLAYDAQYGKDFRDVVGGRKVMYNCLYKLNRKEWLWVREGVGIVRNEYSDHEALRFFEDFIDQRF